MKRFAAVFLILVLAAGLFSACSGENGGESSKAPVSEASPSAASASEVPVSEASDMAALAQQLKGAFTAAEVREFSAEEIEQDTGIAAGDCEAFVWLAEVSGLSSEKAVVFLAKDEAKADDIQNRLNTVLQSELAQMKDYNADNYAMLQKAQRGRQGLYLWLLVSPAVDSLAAIIDGAI